MLIVDVHNRDIIDRFVRDRYVHVCVYKRVLVDYVYVYVPGRITDQVCQDIF